MKKYSTKKLLKDPKHWIGWLLTTGVISLLLWLFNVLLVSIFKGILIIFLAVVGVDLIKHKVKLQ